MVTAHKGRVLQAVPTYGTLGDVLAVNRTHSEVDDKSQKSLEEAFGVEENIHRSIVDDIDLHVFLKHAAGTLAGRAAVTWRSVPRTAPRHDRD